MSILCTCVQAQSQSCHFDVLIYINFCFIFRAALCSYTNKKFIRIEYQHEKINHYSNGKVKVSFESRKEWCWLTTIQTIDGRISATLSCTISNKCSVVFVQVHSGAVLSDLYNSFEYLFALKTAVYLLVLLLSKKQLWL